MEKLRFFAKEEPLEYLKAFFWHAFVDKCMLTSDLLLISQLVRPLGSYVLSVSAPPEKLDSLIVRRRTNRGSTVCQQSTAYIGWLKRKLVDSSAIF